MQLLLHPFLRQPFRHLLRRPTWPDFEAILLPAFEFYSRLRDQKLQNEIVGEINQKLLKVDYEAMRTKITVKEVKKFMFNILKASLN
jgi:hypothetical protein